VGAGTGMNAYDFKAGIGSQLARAAGVGGRLLDRRDGEREPGRAPQPDRGRRADGGGADRVRAPQAPRRGLRHRGGRDHAPLLQSAGGLAKPRARHRRRFVRRTHLGARIGDRFSTATKFRRVEQADHEARGPVDHRMDPLTRGGHRSDGPNRSSNFVCMATTTDGINGVTSFGSFARPHGRDPTMAEPSTWRLGSANSIQLSPIARRPRSGCGARPGSRSPSRRSSSRPPTPAARASWCRCRP